MTAASAIVCYLPEATCGMNDDAFVSVLVRDVLPVFYTRTRALKHDKRFEEANALLEKHESEMMMSRPQA